MIKHSHVDSCFNDTKSWTPPPGRMWPNLYVSGVKTAKIWWQQYRLIWTWSINALRRYHSLWVTETQIHRCPEKYNNQAFQFPPVSHIRLWLQLVKVGESNRFTCACGRAREQTHTQKYAPIRAIFNTTHTPHDTYIEMLGAAGRQQLSIHHRELRMRELQGVIKSRTRHREGGERGRGWETEARKPNLEQRKV